MVWVVESRLHPTDLKHFLLYLLKKVCPKCWFQNRRGLSNQIEVRSYLGNLKVVSTNNSELEQAIDQALIEAKQRGLIFPIYKRNKST
jgi:hypothetical protein